MGRGWALVLVLGAAAFAQDAAEDRKRFADGLKKVRTQFRGQRYKKAGKLLERLLVEHEDRNYVRARRPEVLELAKQSAFRAQYGRPDPRKMVSGDLYSFNVNTGSISVRYKEGRFDDWIEKEDVRIYPARFAGPYSLTLKLAQLPSTKHFRLFVCHSDDFYFLVAFPQVGAHRVAAIYGRGRGGDPKHLAQSGPLRYRRGVFRFAVHVTRKRVVVTSRTGKRLVSVEKPDGRWGTVGMLEFDLQEVHLKGKTEPAWLQGKIDKEDQRWLAEFEKKWDPKKALPAWLFRKASGSRLQAEPPPQDWPVDLSAADDVLLAQALALIQRGKYQECLDRCVPKGAAAAGDVRTWIGALACSAMGNYQKALLYCRQVLKKYPEFVQARKLEAGALLWLRQHDSASAVYRGLLKKYPGSAELHVDAAKILMRSARHDEAQTLIETALGRGVTSGNMRWINGMLLKAHNGPSWPKRYSYSSRHYEVVSDISQRLCAESARHLERAYAMYVNRLERVSEMRNKRFRVYIFSGQGGYLKYCRDLMGFSPAMSAGLYDPLLKQLLIWNLPAREDMMKTVRHEGFHQYLDRVMETAPLWFNEGLAVYYGEAKVEAGEWKLGRAPTQRLKALRGKRLVPLKEFLYMGRTRFMKDASHNYAQAWTWIHFLLHKGYEEKRLFEAFWKAFRESPSNWRAIDSVVATVDLAEVEGRYRAHAQWYLDRIGKID